MRRRGIRLVTHTILRFSFGFGFEANNFLINDLLNGFLNSVTDDVSHLFLASLSILLHLFRCILPCHVRRRFCAVSRRLFLNVLVIFLFLFECFFLSLYILVHRLVKPTLHFLDLVFHFLLIFFLFLFSVAQLLLEIFLILLLLFLVLLHFLIMLRLFSIILLCFVQCFLIAVGLCLLIIVILFR